MAKLKNCKACGKEVSSSAKTCPNCGHKQKGGFFKKFLIVLLCFIFVSFIIGLIVGEPSENQNSAVAPSTSSDSNGSSNKDTNKQAAEAPEKEVTDPRPKDQIEFVDVLLKASEDSSNAENDMQLGAVLNQRDKQLCGLLNSNKTVSDWVAEVQTVEANSDGKGVISLLLAEDMELGTWNNAISDTFDNTLIDPDSQIFATGSNLKRGDIVKFSGEFFTADEGCLTESSMALSSKIQSPYFIFKFSDLQPVQ